MSENMIMTKKYEYIERFRRLGFGLFVHFGLYSMMGKGEWYYSCVTETEKKKYRALVTRFKVQKSWAKSLVRIAKLAGAKYIVLTTRHHDGFSMYDTKGLSDYDAPHSACGRDLVGDFVEACREENIVPFFYHTLLDWYHKDYQSDFPKYIDYLAASLEVLCKNYGKIGGFWFDGMWDKPNEDWQEDRIYGIIRRYQPEAIITNNTGLSAQGKTGHKEIDSVTFERGKPFAVTGGEKPLAGEMCQILNDHWGYAKDDINYKSVKELVENLVDCRKYSCNFLLNVGPKGNGMINPIDKYLLYELGKWIKTNKNFIYKASGTELFCKGGEVFCDGKDLYVIVKNVPMLANSNVAYAQSVGRVQLEQKIKRAYWLDNGQKIHVKENSFDVVPFRYGTSLSVRVARIILSEDEI